MTEMMPKIEALDESSAQRLAMFTPKSPLVGLLLTLFIGQIGVGRFYAGSIARGIVCIVLMLVGFGFLACAQGLEGVIAIGPWAWMVLLDLFCIYGEIKRSNLARLYEVLGIPIGEKLKKSMREHIIVYWVLLAFLSGFPLIGQVLFGLF